MSLFCCRAFGAALSASLKLMGGGAAPPPKPSPKVFVFRRCSHDRQVRSTSIRRRRPMQSIGQVVCSNPVKYTKEGTSERMSLVVAAASARPFTLRSDRWEAALPPSQALSTGLLIRRALPRTPAAALSHAAKKSRPSCDGLLFLSGKRPFYSWKAQPAPPAFFTR